MPTPLRTPQTSGHFSSRVSNLTLRSLKPPPSHGSKNIIFHLSQSKCTVSALFQGMQGALWLAKYDKGCRNYAVKNHDVLHKNDVNSKLLKSECSARWALLIRGPWIRVPSSAPKGRWIVERNGLSSFCFIWAFGTTRNVLARQRLRPSVCWCARWRKWTTKPPCVGVFQVHQRGIAEDRICPESYPLHWASRTAMWRAMRSWWDHSLTNRSCSPIL